MTDKRTPGRSPMYGGNPLLRFRYRRRLEIVRSLVSGHLSPAARVCDLGCGDGTWLRFLEPEIGYGIGMDLGWGDTTRGWGLVTGKVALERRDFLDAELPAGSFDIVSCLETLEHVDDPEAVLRRMNELCRPGGIVVVSVPIELGPSLLCKEIAARLTAYKRTSEPSDRWTIRETLRGVLGDIEAVKRARRESSRATHKGFDYREVKRLFREIFRDVRTRGTPYPLLGEILNVGIVCAGVRDSG
jgi:SAM-dependent methyltransferase